MTGASASARRGAHTERLAAFAADLRLADVPEQVRARAKYVALDGFGCGLFGASLPWSELLSRTIQRLSGGGAAAVWGTSHRLPPDHAALLNGSYVQAFEIDDYHPDGALHVCAVVLPAALAAAEAAGGVSGTDLLAAIIAGFEVGPRVGQCLGSTLILERGWHSGSVIGVMAAAAAAGRVLGLEPGQMAQAFGIAGTQASGLMAAQFGSMVKRMHHGRAAQSGLYAALLARDGYTGIERVFEERYGGYSTTLTATADGFDLDKLVDGLGERFETLRIAIKLYSCNASIHPAIDAIKAIRAGRPFDAGEVRRVTVRCTKSTLEHVGWAYQPTSMTAAQMNMSFGIAATIAFDDAFVDQYTDEAIRSPLLLDLARRVRVAHEPAFDALGPRHRHHLALTIEFADGSRDTEEIDAGLGSPARPASNGRIAEKFDRLSRSALGCARARALREAVTHLEDQVAASVLTELLTPAG